jgi:hypothetical protein
MKSTNFIPCLIIALNVAWSPALNAQSYLPMAVEDATWIMGYGFESYNYYIHFAYKLQGDSLYQGETYKKLYLWDLEDNTDPPYQTTDHELVGLMRDDTTARKVYGVFFSEIFEMIGCDSPQAQEFLLYDFSLSSGDSLRDCFTDEYGTRYTVDSISMQYVYGQERRIWHIDGNPLITEAVGNMFGLFALSNPVVHAAEGPYLFDYCVGTNFECGLHTATASVVRDPDFRIFPNPASDVLNIQSTQLFRSAILFQTTGLMVDHYQLASSQTIRIHDLLPGLYILRLERPDQQIATARFLKL